MYNTDDYIAEVELILSRNPDGGHNGKQLLVRATALNATAIMLSRKAMITIISRTYTDRDARNHLLLGSLLRRPSSRDGLGQFADDLWRVLDHGPRTLPEKTLASISCHIERAKKIAEQRERICNLKNMHKESGREKIAPPAAAQI